jgi:uncharacterized protein YndB with AHSA1/START domain
MNQTAPTATAIERELRIAAPPDRVFDLWTDERLLPTWMGRTVQLDARPGGAWRIDYNGSDIASGTFLELERPSRIVMTWGWEAPGDPVPPGASTVEVTLTPDGDGTLLRLRHLGLPEASRSGHEVGWDQFLAGLRDVAASG